MELDATGKSSWEINQKAVMLSYTYDEVLVERKDGKLVIVCRGKKKLQEGRGG